MLIASPPFALTFSDHCYRTSLPSMWPSEHCLPTLSHHCVSVARYLPVLLNRVDLCGPPRSYWGVNTLRPSLDTSMFLFVRPTANPANQKGRTKKSNLRAGGREMSNLRAGGGEKLEIEGRAKGGGRDVKAAGRERGRRRRRRRGEWNAKTGVEDKHETLRETLRETLCATLRETLRETSRETLHETLRETLCTVARNFARNFVRYFFRCIFVRTKYRRMFRGKSRRLFRGKFRPVFRHWW